MAPSTKVNASLTALLTAGLLATAKLLLGLVTGSMALLSSAIDSLLDVLMSSFNYWALRQADKPADANHPYGHGKFETMATLVQALIIAGTGFIIIAEAIKRLRFGSELRYLPSGIVLLLICAAVSWWLSRFLRRRAQQTDSSALKADAVHYAMDVYTNLALVAGLVVVQLWQVAWLDPVISMLVAGYILWEAARLLRRSLGDMLDEHLPEEALHIITSEIRDPKGRILGIHQLRTRRAGSLKLIDFHVTFCRHLSVEEAHEVVNTLEKRIKKRLPQSDVLIHIDPCQCPECPYPEPCSRQQKAAEHPSHS